MERCCHFSSVTQSCRTLCDPVDYSRPGFPVHHQLLELTQTHVHGVSDAIQPSCPLSSPYPAFNLSQHQGLFQWVSSSHQGIGVSASGSVLPMNIQDWFPLGWTGWIYLQSKGLSRVFSNTMVQKHQFFGTQLSSCSNFQPIALNRWTFVGKAMSLLFNKLSRLVITFLPRSKHLLISWLPSFNFMATIAHGPSAMILEPPKIKSHCFHCFPIYLPWSNGTRCHS